MNPSRTDDVRRRRLSAPSLSVLAFSVVVLLWPLPSFAQAPVPALSAILPPAPALAPSDMPDLAHDNLTLVAVPDLPPDFVLEDRGWIRFAFPESERARVAQLVAASDDIRGALASELGAEILETVDVRVARTPTELASLAPASMPPPRYAVGVAYARARLVVLSIEAPQSSELPDLVEVFRHELAHVGLFDAVRGRPVPRWFNEGYAIHMSGESSLGRAQTLWRASLGKRLIPLSELDQGFPSDSDQAAVAYAESADFVRFLMRREDRDRFKRFVGRLASGQSFEAAMGSAYSSNLRGLEFEWREQLRGRYSYVPLFLGGGLLWILVFAVVGVGWHRRRKRHKLTLKKWARDEAVEDALQTDEMPDVLRIKLIPRPPAPPLVHVASPDEGSAPSEEANREVLQPVAAARAEVPKLEHDGRWHTLH